MELHELRAAGMSRTRVRWATNPTRGALFRLILPYLEVIARRIDQLAARMEAERRADAATRDDMVAALRRGLFDQIRDEAVAGIREAALADVRARALADVREQTVGEVRRELAGNRAETRAMSNRFASMEDMLREVSQWVEGTEAHARELSAELRAALATVNRRIDTIESLGPARADGRGDTLAGTGLVIADNPYGRFMVRHPDVVGDALLRGEFWDSHLKPVIEAHADPDGVAIDAGAYIGFHSVFMARHFGRVFAFEPQADVYGLLRTNLQLNGCRNVTAAERGLYSRPCWLALAPDSLQEVAVPRVDGTVDYGRIDNAAALTFVETEPGAAGAVQAVTIDGLGLDRVRFLKVDTQGADLEVLRGAAETIGRCRPAIAFEFERELSAAHCTDFAAFEAFFAGLGYGLRELHRTSEGKQTDYLATPL